VPYYTVKFLPIEDLDEAMGKSGETSRVIFIAKVIRDIASTLDYLHSRGVVHRNIKPSVIRFDDFGNVYLINFIIARPIQDIEESEHIVGTLDYMSPEQLRGGHLDGKTDQYSLALTAFKMLTGQLPFYGKTPQEIIWDAFEKTTLSIIRWLPDAPEVLDTVFQRALAKTPDERFPTASAFAEALEKALRFMGKRLRVFVSYSTKNRPQLEALVQALEDQNHVVWYDRELKNRGGQNWWATILHEIRECDLFVFGLTPEAMASYPCQMEYTYAHQLNKRVLPVMLSPVDTNTLPAPLAVLQMVNFTNTDGRFVLETSIDNLPSIQPLPYPLPPEPREPISEMHRLAEQVETPGLTEDEQLLLIVKLERYLDEAKTASTARNLLQKMQQGSGLFVTADTQIRKVLERHQLT
jgi:serine/threonine protein kinase